ncbi:para-aminobenzoate synthetase component 1 [Desulfofundulus australicus DSM 11792]|uniref:aminodeoxychorismate synthase n=1 Tax=Desulfofundulus australicus DSM 11792 TaxID=1121425 RepID=A0A1M4U813_9FIRM|nr:aminodeoxychorismate synthase component I [Desulfofundulus australicus]SHE52922.1 para-aminobenzoate synthetase component 1 [Desulfofundulus australicus DSM 11792]
MPVHLPLIKKLPVTADVPALFESLSSRPYSFLLDSGIIVRGLGRYSLMGADPFLVLRSKGKRLWLEYQGKRKSLAGHPLEKLKNLLNRFHLPQGICPLPLCGGAVGYFSYDLGRLLEKMPSLTVDDLQTPDLCLGFYDVVTVLDGITGEVWVVSTGFPEIEPAAALQRAKHRLAETCTLLSSCRQQQKPDIFTTSANHEQPLTTVNQHKSHPGKQDVPPLTAHFDEASYCRTVERAREYIAAGDIFQVNLSQRFSLPRVVEPWPLYQQLRRINPAPMAAYLNFGEFQLVCSSPERFLKVTGRRVETRPIKGTRPRGNDPVSDIKFRDELWNSEKDRAELVMIVDMERNDLGRVCRTGSVRVPELYRLEEYATVFHLVSTVEGELAPDKDVVDLLAATFPGGSISGAPKIRAMEIIEELEPVRRGIYTGSIGYIGFDGNADLNIVIRTLIFKGEQIYFQVGGGITIDSDPYMEYVETLDKARALVRALGLDDRQAFSSLTVKPVRE